ncbi:MAG: hypothetical protein M1825_001328 [Sarcosagium campestre]|nr:MAG: hypothetical protein M1825_001328 [Sarcosagium campestre]
MGGGPQIPSGHTDMHFVSDGDVKSSFVRKDYLRGIVDMGSNGIRFSISDLSPPTSRVLPTVYLHRVGISLYEAQHDAVSGDLIPIPDSVTKDVIAALLRFKTVCADFGVKEKHIRVLATEATRTALNSVEYRRAIKDATGWTVDMLGKEEEGEVGALGIASSFASVRGLVMDLGGGSTQITWMISQDGQVRTSPKVAVSFPYGAAAMTRRLAEAEKGKDEDEVEKAKEVLRQEMRANFQKAYEELEIPEELVEAAKAEGGFPLYLSGGGFRGWGYLLLSQSQIHEHRYPISIINGFYAHREDFENTEKLKKIAKRANKIFRVSDRRRGQVPAVAFLINVLAKALPHGIKEARFCQGGIREGVLFRELPASVRMVDPLPVATAPFASPSAPAIAKLLLNAIPEPGEERWQRCPASISVPVIHGFANMLYEHAEIAKESASTAALYSTSTGVLASAHGVSHANRALLAIMLDERFEGELPPRDADFRVHLERLLSPEEVWWCRYIGTTAWLVAETYPSGQFDEAKPRLGLSAKWASGLGKKGKKDGVELLVSIRHQGNDPMTEKKMLKKDLKTIDKVGKKKNWIGGKSGWGLGVRTVIVEDLV